MDEMAIQNFAQHVLKDYYAQADCELLSLNTRALDDARIVYKMYQVTLRLD